MIPVAVSLNLNEFTNGDLLPTVVVGLLIVFAVLAVIYICLVVMERIFRSKAAARTHSVTAPFGGSVQSLSAGGNVGEGTVVAVVRDDAGAAFELLSPVSGTLKQNVQGGASFQKDDTLFWVESELSAGKKAGRAHTVVAPFGGSIRSLSAGGPVEKGAVVAVMLDRDGAAYELLSPVSGTLKLKVQSGASFQKDDTLFWVE